MSKITITANTKTKLFELRHPIYLGRGDPFFRLISRTVEECFGRIIMGCEVYPIITQWIPSDLEPIDASIENHTKLAKGWLTRDEWRKAGGDQWRTDGNYGPRDVSLLGYRDGKVFRVTHAHHPDW